ncbi:MULTISPECIES: hypothetical protein [Cryobacterium]|uniref:DUF2946 domain-containing protein n=1 Tax=Cryobacterium breve TaxID=1259258 RepID=A0ABY2J139_9MICO|nr:MULTISPECIES: hypothetical protein [Cryobacterium]TFC96780.1 hypothetical protein E3T20_01895 [Cryobacterium sp. TmT3-12]TFC97423.1 hypothetical protein E3O65_11605 [Cryobacterium breve]
MKLDTTTHIAPPRRPVLLSGLVALVALAALLFGVLAMNSTHAGHETGGTAVASDPTAQVGVSPVVMAGAVSAVSVIAHTGLGPVDCSDCMLDCAILAMTCTILLVIASLILLARLPSTYRRLLDAGGHIARLSHRLVLDIHRPNLTVLSISRI